LAEYTDLQAHGLSASAVCYGADPRLNALYLGDRRGHAVVAGLQGPEEALE